LVIFSLLSQKNFFGYSWSTYLFLLLLALIPQLIGHTTINWALKYLPASMVGITYLGEPVGSTLLAYFILGERLTPLKVFGGILILAGILTALKKKPQGSRKE
jgi:drug/metabolite transporter (DMT)-like permease